MSNKEVGKKAVKKAVLYCIVMFIAGMSMYAGAMLVNHIFPLIGEATNNVCIVSKGNVTKCIDVGSFNFKIKD